MHLIVFIIENPSITNTRNTKTKKKKVKKIDWSFQRNIYQRSLVNSIRLKSKERIQKYYAVDKTIDLFISENEELIWILLHLKGRGKAQPVLELVIINFRHYDNREKLVAGSVNFQIRITPLSNVWSIIYYYWSFVILFDMSKIDLENIPFIRERHCSEREKRRQMSNVRERQQKKKNTRIHRTMIRMRWNCKREFIIFEKILALLSIVATGYALMINKNHFIRWFRYNT